VELAKLGFRVLAFNFRGFGLSRGPAQEHFDRAPFELDVLAAVQYLQKAGAKSISVVGGSFGAGASAKAAVAEPNLIECLVLLGATPEGPAEQLTMRKLYIMTRDDANAAGRRLPALQAHFEKAPEPKRLLILDGSAHAQFIFETDDAERVMKEIIRFLSPDTSPQAKRSKKSLGEEAPGH
jgi:pimeloyl-ACP methyl ester carboxylesterase